MQLDLTYFLEVKNVNYDFGVMEAGTVGINLVNRFDYLLNIYPKIDYYIRKKSEI